MLPGLSVRPALGMGIGTQAPYLTGGFGIGEPLVFIADGYRVRIVTELGSDRVVALVASERVAGETGPVAPLVVEERVRALLRPQVSRLAVVVRLVPDAGDADTNRTLTDVDVERTVKVYVPRRIVKG